MTYQLPEPVSYCQNSPERIEARYSDDQLQAAYAAGQRDAAFAMSRCQCGTDEACANLAKLTAELVNAKAELERLTSAFEPFLKEGETPFERFIRERKDGDALLKVYGLALKEQAALKTERDELKAENCKLAAGTCCEKDGLTADDGGVIFCRVAQERDALKADAERYRVMCGLDKGKPK